MGDFSDAVAGLPDVCCGVSVLSGLSANQGPDRSFHGLPTNTRVASPDGIWVAAFQAG